MVKSLLLSLLSMLAALGLQMAHASNEPTKADAVAMVERTAAALKAQGLEPVKAKIVAKDVEFNTGGLYVAVRGLDGTMLAHPNTKFIGGNLIDVPDPDGKLFRKEIVDTAKSKGNGWVDYKFKNPSNDKLEEKTTYFLRVGDWIVEAGIYK